MIRFVYPIWNANKKYVNTQTIYREREKNKLKESLYTINKFQF